MVNRNYLFNYYRKKLPDSDRESIRYLTIHAKRYAFLLNCITKIRTDIPCEKGTILDIGPSYLTEQLQLFFKNDTVYSMGFSLSEGRGGHLPEAVTINRDTFIRFDLNDTQDTAKWVPIPQCDIIVMAEVIEHLYTDPLTILNFLKTGMKKDGFLIIQTPNAVSLDKRIKMLCGKHPYAMITENKVCPGHFREYTKNELFTLATMSNLHIRECTYNNYFDLSPVTYKTIGYRMLQRLLGKSFRDGITILLQKNE